MTTKEKLLKALEIEKEGEWDKAHEIVQVMHHKLAYWVHAYLHRKEPDLSNASYWYSRIGRSRPSITLEEEWEELANHLLNI